MRKILRDIDDLIREEPEREVIKIGEIDREKKNEERGDQS